MKLKLISCFFNKGSHIDVYRDKYSKFYVRADGKITQRKLNAEEVVRWFSNMMNDK